MRRSKSDTASRRNKDGSVVRYVQLAHKPNLHVPRWVAQNLLPVGPFDLVAYPGPALSRFATALSFLFGGAGFVALLFNVSLLTFILWASAIVVAALLFTALPTLRLILSRAALFAEVAQELEDLEETKRREAFQLANLIKEMPVLVEKSVTERGLRLIGESNDSNIRPGARFELRTEHGGVWLGTLEVVRRDGPNVELRPLASLLPAARKFWDRNTKLARRGEFKAPSGVVLTRYEQVAEIVSPALASARVLSWRSSRRR
jgi:hypothetical protein